MKWAFKILAKMLISRAPLPYGFWKLLGIFRHGQMDSTEYPAKIFNLHVSRAYPDGLPEDAVILELGPGDSLASALLGGAHGAAKTFLVDVGAFARRDIGLYRSMASQLQQRGIDTPDISDAVELCDVLDRCNAQYLTDGLESLKSIPSQSVDFVWSHSVLEHVRYCEFEATLKELKRILKPGGLMSNNIDYQDHLDYSLNNLRFSTKLWETPLFASSGFYTNRIPAVRMHKMFRDAGFEVLQEEFGKWPSLPIPRKVIHRDFDQFTDDQLINRTSHALLRA